MFAPSFPTYRRRAIWLDMDASDLRKLDRQRITDPQHPGIVVRDILAAMGIGPTAAANAMGLASRPTLSALFGGRKPMTPRMAEELGRLAEVPPYSLLRLQLEWDFAEAMRLPPDNGTA